MKPILFPAIALTIITPLLAAPVFQEKGGVLVMEAESTSSSLGSWKKKTDVADYSGDCHLEFTGNKAESGPPKSPLKYTLTISGRSKNFNIDRIFFVHEDANLGKVKKDNPKESMTDAIGGGTGTSSSKLKTYPTRELKNKDGRAIKAQLVEKNGNILTIIKDGRRFEIPISSLSHQDQEFLKDWWSE